MPRFYWNSSSAVAWQLPAALKQRKDEVQDSAWTPACHYKRHLTRFTLVFGTKETFVSIYRKNFRLCGFKNSNPVHRRLCHALTSGLVDCEEISIQFTTAILRWRQCHDQTQMQRLASHFLKVIREKRELKKLREAATRLLESPKPQEETPAVPAPVKPGVYIPPFKRESNASDAPKPAVAEVRPPIILADPFVWWGKYENKDDLIANYCYYYSRDPLADYARLQAIENLDDLKAELVQFRQSFLGVTSGAVSIGGKTLHQYRAEKDLPPGRPKGRIFSEEWLQGYTTLRGIATDSEAMAAAMSTSELIRKNAPLLGRRMPRPALVPEAELPPGYSEESVKSLRRYALFGTPVPPEHIPGPQPVVQKQEMVAFTKDRGLDFLGIGRQTVDYFKPAEHYIISDEDAVDMLDMGVFEEGSKDYELLKARVEFIQRHPGVSTTSGIPIRAYGVNNECTLHLVHSEDDPESLDSYVAAERTPLPPDVFRKLYGSNFET